VNKDLIFLLPSPPDPRIMKRVSTFIKNNYNLGLIYWNRFDWNYGIDDIRIDNVSYGRPFQNNSFLIRLFKYIPYFYFCLKNIRKYNPKLIYAANIDMLNIAVVYKILFNKDIKIIYEVADLGKRMISYYSVFLKNLEKCLLNWVDLLILTSSGFWDIYFNKIFTKEKLLIIENCPSKDIFKEFERKQKNDDFVIGLIGFVRFAEQIFFLMDTTKNMKNVKIFIAGGGPDLDVVKQKAKIYSNVEVFGKYAYEDIASLYSKIDCIYSVFDKNWKGGKFALTNRLYDAILCDLPIIVAKDSLLSYYVNKYKIGFAVNSNSREELIKAINLLKKDSKYIDIIKKNCDVIKENFIWENMETKLYKGINKLIEIRNEKRKLK